MSKSEMSAKRLNKYLMIALACMTLIVIVLIIALVLSNGDADSAKNAVTPTEEPGVTIAVTDTPAPTAEATPTAVTSPTTEVSPTEAVPTTEATPSAEATPTAEATPAATPTAVPTATPTTAPTATPTTAPTATPTPKPTESGTPVANHGQLSVKGTQLVDKNGKAYQLKGVSTHGLQWFPQFVCMETFQCVRDEWGANAVRLAMYTDENGYCAGGDKAKLKALVKNGVNYAKQLGLYVIIDWHILHDNDPNQNKAEAIAFFKEMAAEFKDYNNVLYEICNEPNGGTSWSSVKSYAMEVIPAIRAIDNDAIIIVGTPTWSQDVDVAAKDPIKGYDNIMYALHFYAGTHKDSLRSKMKTAIEAGLPVFVSEYGICDASGNGMCDEAEANRWVAFMDSYGVSYMIWNLANKNESSSLIRESCKKLSGFREADLNQEGIWFVKMLGGKIPPMTEKEKEELLNNAGGNGGGDVASPPAVSAKATVNGLTVEFATTNTWNETADKCYQFGVRITNGRSNSAKNWKIVITFNTDVKSNNFWCCDAKCSGKTLTLTPADFNKTVSAGASTMDIGLILQSKSLLKVESITITAE